MSYYWNIQRVIRSYNIHQCHKSLLVCGLQNENCYKSCFFSTKTEQRGIFFKRWGAFSSDFQNPREVYEHLLYKEKVTFWFVSENLCSRLEDCLRLEGRHLETSAGFLNHSFK